MEANDLSLKTDGVILSHSKWDSIQTLLKHTTDQTRKYSLLIGYITGTLKACVEFESPLEAQIYKTIMKKVLDEVNTKFFPAVVDESIDFDTFYDMMNK